MKLTKQDGDLLLAAMIQAQLSDDPESVEKIAKLAANPEEFHRILGSQHTGHVQHPRLPKSRLNSKNDVDSKYQKPHN